MPDTLEDRALEMLMLEISKCYAVVGFYDANGLDDKFVEENFTYLFGCPVNCF